MFTTLTKKSFKKSGINQQFGVHYLLEEPCEPERGGDQNDEKVQSKTYTRSVCDLYLPAMATALDLHIRVIQSISGYYAILNTLPVKQEKPNKKMKVINLIFEDNKYSPVIYFGQDAEMEKSHKLIAEVH